MNFHDHFYIKENVLYHKQRHGGLLPDTIAGCKSFYGYIVVQVAGKRYPAHRVIWEMNVGEIPEGVQVDHINHDRADNRIENLRLVSARNQNFNRGIAKNNISGLSGVNWHKSIGKWQASIKVDGRSIYLGCHEHLFEAVCARKSAELKHGFHNNHGR